jgi:hypothetical protein
MIVARLCAAFPSHRLLLLTIRRKCPKSVLVAPNIMKKSFTARAIDLDLSREFVRDTILYQTNNIPRLRRLQLAAFLNLILWSYFGIYVLRRLGSMPVDMEKQMILEKNPDKVNTPAFTIWEKISLTERKYHTYLAVMCSAVGYLSAFLIGFYSSRSVNTLIVKRGASEATILTSRMLSISKLREITVPLNHVSCITSREVASAYMTIKIKGHRFNFLVDKQGTFYNTYLFDRTFGVQRNLGK